MESTKKPLELPRQRQPIRIDAFGLNEDVDYYLNRIKALIESSTYDNVERMGNQLKIYPAANND